MKPLTRRILPTLVCLALLAGAASAQDVASFEKRITLKKLPNGLTLLICERPEAPVFSFFTHVDVGSVQEVPGITGLAHMFEHMAFKGHGQDRHHQLRRREGRVGQSGEGLRRL